MIKSEDQSGIKNKLEIYKFKHYMKYHFKKILSKIWLIIKGSIRGMSK